MKKLKLRQIIEVLRTNQGVHIEKTFSSGCETWSVILDSAPESVVWELDSRDEAIEFCEFLKFNLTSVETYRNYD